MKPRSVELPNPVIVKFERPVDSNVEPSTTVKITNPQAKEKPSTSHGQSELKTSAKVKTEKPPIISPYNLLDSALRSPGRWVEIFFCESTYIRPAIRIATETVRHSVVDMARNGKVKTKTFMDLIKGFGVSLKTAFPRIAENVGATVVIDPIKYTHPLARLAAGFANVLGRLTIRSGLVAVGSAPSSALVLENAFDEVVGKSGFRLINFGKGPLKLLSLFLEQIGINEMISKLPIKRVFNNQIQKLKSLHLAKVPNKKQKKQLNGTVAKIAF